jgi:hypothetical protein
MTCRMAALGTAHDSLFTRRFEAKLRYRFVPRKNRVKLAM